MAVWRNSLLLLRSGLVGERPLGQVLRQLLGRLDRPGRLADDRDVARRSRMKLSSWVVFAAEIESNWLRTERCSERTER